MSEKLSDELDRDLVLQEKPLYDLDKEVKNMEYLANKELELVSKRLYLLSTRSKSG
jgi:hypothetical protein